MKRYGEAHIFRTKDKVQRIFPETGARIKIKKRGIILSKKSIRQEAYYGSESTGGAAKY